MEEDWSGVVWVVQSAKGGLSLFSRMAAADEYRAHLLERGIESLLQAVHLQQ